MKMIKIMSDEITDEEIHIHLAQINHIKSTSNNKKVIADAEDAEKTIKEYQKIRKAMFN